MKTVIIEHMINNWLMRI